MIKDRNWTVYSYEYGEGQRAIISFDVDLAKEEYHTKYFNMNRIIIFIPINFVNTVNGIYLNDISPEIILFEDCLVENLSKGEVDCKYVGKMIYGGMVDFVFQVEEQNNFQKIIKKTLKRNNNFKFELKSDTGWKFFDEKVCPQPIFWQQISDAKVITELIKAGSDPTKKHVIEHIIIGSGSNLDKVFEYIKSVGLNAIKRNDNNIVIKVETVLDIDEIFKISGFLFNTSKKYEVEYDGWGALVEK